MISKNTFVTMINTISEVIEESKAMCSCPIPGSFFDDDAKSELLAGCDYQQDLIKMLEVVMIDRYSVIHDFLYKRDENGELFFGIPQFDGVIKVFLISSAEELYDYLLEQAAETLWDFVSSIVR
ncbi:MAG: hypothetical protein Q4E74_03075 [Ruminococcus sp.]|nr:hypothetical protein [Ruminococcus sp.]